jgi:hypothetical protein
MRIPFKIAIPVFKTKNYKIAIAFRKRFKTSENIISLGSACHPAYLLDAMGFRKMSMPFDWQLTHPINGLEYVCDNIKTNFRFFMDDLKLNTENQVYASRNPFAVFFHYPDVISNPATKVTFTKRCARFADFTKNNRCTFLYSATSSAINSDAAANQLLQSVNEFKQLMKPADRLLIYVNFTESFSENSQYCEQFINAASAIENVKAAKFLLQHSIYGQWGYENNYASLLKQLGFKFRSSIPSIKFLKQKI